MWTNRHRRTTRRLVVFKVPLSAAFIESPSALSQMVIGVSGNLCQNVKRAASCVRALVGLRTRVFKRVDKDSCGAGRGGRRVRPPRRGANSLRLTRAFYTYS